MAENNICINLLVFPGIAFPDNRKKFPDKILLTIKKNYDML